jgi:hypothetical protein
MYHYRARTYSPTLGRFLQTDPIGFDGGMNILPSSSMMMMPLTDEPTIMAIADPMGTVALTRGPDC